MRARRRRRRATGMFVVTLAAALLAACQADTPEASPGETASPVETMVVEASATPTSEPAATATAADTATPEATATMEAMATPAETATPLSAEAGAGFALVGDGPVVPHGPPGSWDRQFTDPGAVLYHDGLFHMLHNGFVGWPAPVGVAYSMSPDGYTWTRVQGEPVFRGDDLEYVGLTALASSALVQEDGTWVLYFYTWDERRWPGSPSSIGRATAPAPIGPWTADAEPLLVPGPDGAWDSPAVRAPSVLRGEDGYVMYYTGFDAQRGMIGMATSPDGVQWTKHDDPASGEAPFAESDPVFEPGPEDAWDAGNVINPRVVRSPEGLVMLYSATQRLNATNRLGLAFSEDGVSWQRAAEPVLDHTAAPGGRAIWFSALEHLDGTYFLFFELGTGGETEVYLATAEGALLQP